MSWMTLILVVLASARTWRLLAMDGIAFRVRNWVHKRLPTMMQEGWYCPFCLGFWLACLWVLTGVLWGNTTAWTFVAGCFALNYAAAQLNAWLDERPVTDSGGEIGE
jgi:hypothetical protein